MGRLKTRLDTVVDVAGIASNVQALGDYADKLKKLDASWAAMRQSLVESQYEAVELTNLLASAATETQKANAAMGRFASAAKTVHNTFDNMLRSTASLEKALARTSVSFVTVLGSAAVSAIGFAANLVFSAGAWTFWNILGLAPWVVAQRQAAAGLGASIGSYASYVTNFQALSGAGNYLAAAQSSRYDLTSSLNITLGRLSGGDTSERAIDIMRKAWGIAHANAGNPEWAVPAFKQAQLNNLDSTDAAELMATTKGDLEYYIEQWRKYKKLTDIPSDVAEKWASFATTLNSAGAQVEAAFGRNLAPLGEALNHVTEGLKDLAVSMGKSQNIKEWIKNVADGVDWLSKQVGGSAIKFYIDELVLGLTNLSKVLKYWAPIIAKTAGVAKGVYDWLMQPGGSKGARPLSEFLPSWLQEGNTQATPEVQTQPGARPSIRYGSRPPSSNGTNDRLDPSRVPQIDGNGNTVPTPGQAFAEVPPQEGETPQQLTARVQAHYPQLSHQQCVSMATVLAGTGRVTSYRRGDPFATTDVPVGTPLATFEDRFHRPSNLYDAGGTGSPGTDSSHVVVYAGTDADGNKMVWSTSAGERPHLMTLDPNSASHEHNPNAYYTINDPQGLPAGTRNPYRTRVMRERGLLPRPLPPMPVQPPLPMLQPIGADPGPQSSLRMDHNAYAPPYARVVNNTGMDCVVTHNPSYA